MFIEMLDHLVLTVRDIERTCDFYKRVLGMKIVEFAGGRKALNFGRQKINLHQSGAEFNPHARQPVPGSADLCFLTALPVDEFVQHCRNNKIDILEGPVRRTGAMGPILSVYLRDPDGNLLEVANRMGENLPDTSGEE